MKAGETTRGIPVIALTSHVMPTEMEVARAAGADDYETKPVNFARLLEKIQTHTTPAAS